MKRVKYLKSIDKYLPEETFFRLILDNGYIAPIRYKYKGLLDISIMLRPPLTTFSDEEIKEIEKACEEQGKLVRNIDKKIDRINMILLWGTKYFFANSMEDNPYLYATPVDVHYSITDMNGRFVAGEFSSPLMDKKFKHLYQPLLLELKAFLINSGWFTDIKDTVKHKISRDFFDKIDTKDAYVQDMSDKDSIDIKVVRYKDRKTLFIVKQEDDAVDEDLLFAVSYDSAKESFDYTCKIVTEEDFKKALKNTIDSIDPYDSFDSYEDNLEDIYEEICR